MYPARAFGGCLFVGCAEEVKLRVRVAGVGKGRSDVIYPVAMYEVDRGLYRLPRVVLLHVLASCSSRVR